MAGRRLASTNIPFSRTKLGEFSQSPPKLFNPYLDDVAVQRYLQSWIPSDLYKCISADLTRFGGRVVSELESLSRQCEVEQPRLEQYDAWGNRIDKLITSPAWKRMKDISAEEGFVSLGYEKNKYKQFSRLYQYAKLYLYSASAGLYTCPLAMTDGAAKVIRELGIRDKTGDAFDRLTTRDPSKFWTSGQWMTERRGGSDVAGGTETIALKENNGNYKLYGHKWFSSATDADMSLCLARMVGSDGKPIQGTKGLSLFFLVMHDGETGKLNNIEMIRLKNKLGTRQLPTAELLLDGTIATKVSEDGRGVASISHMLNITRIHNALASVAGMRRIISLARDYMHRRKAFGRLLLDWPLHVSTLAHMELETKGCVLLLMRIALLLGLQEENLADKTQINLLRLLTPILKLYTAKQAIWVISEGLECFGGQGYIEDTGLPPILRDAQVTPIWEGTTNVLSMDVCRVLAKDYSGVIHSLTDDINQLLSLANLPQCSKRVQGTLEQIINFPTEFLELAARDFAFTIARTYIGALLIGQAKLPTATPMEIETAKRWCLGQSMSQLKDTTLYNNDTSKTNSEFVLEGYNSKL